jgi:WD40 repeat protein
MLLMASKNLLIEEDLETNMQKFAQHELNSTIDSIDVSESSQRVVTGATKSKGSVRVWKVEDGQFKCELALTVFDADGVDFVCFCGKDDKFVAVVSGKAILLYDLEASIVAGNAVTLEEIGCLVKANSEVRLGCNGTSSEVLVLTGGSGGLLMWSKGTEGNLDFVKTSVQSSKITAACCSGSCILTGSSKGRVEVYGIKEDKILATWLASSEPISCIEGKRGDEIVVVCSMEETLSQWRREGEGGKVRMMVK